MTEKQVVKSINYFLEMFEEDYNGIYLDSNKIIEICVLLRNARALIDRQKNKIAAHKVAQKGCVRCIHGKAFYCYDSKRVYVGADGSVTVYVNGEYIDIPAYFKHCPWCGAPLNALKGGEG